jgi:hypothetical protein
VHQAIALTAATAPAVVVRVVRRDGAVLVSALAEGPVTAADPDDVAELASRVRKARGRLAIEPGPYLELWLPTGGPPDDGPASAGPVGVETIGPRL